MRLAPVKEAGRVNTYRIALLVPFLLAACATETATEAPYDPSQDYEELDATTVLNAPAPVAGNFAPEHRFQVERGKYFVELLACGSCHTDGALEGAPKLNKSLAGSKIGIAFSSPLGTERPGVVYPPNITPDKETGIGLWSDQEIERAIRIGLGRHAERRIAVMPWQGYTKMTNNDVTAIVSYLRSIDPVEHQVPDEVAPGQKASSPFVYFGVYRSR
jgi:mono/diheme cytochrome c family protein